MEEQSKAKQIKMNASAGKSENKQQKLTYEQLNDACNQLWQQNKQLVSRNTLHNWTIISSHTIISISGALLFVENN